MHRLLRCTILLLLSAQPALSTSQTTGMTATATSRDAATGTPLPDPPTLLKEVERNAERMDALRSEYTYHVHTEQQRLRKDGTVKGTEITEAESLTLDGVRVDRVVARNGAALTAQEQVKENDRLDKQVAKAKERRAKATAGGETTDARGDTIITVARLLELGRFSNERRLQYGDRPTILLDYVGDPKAKTNSSAESVVKDLTGTVWIDERDRVLVRGQGQFLNDFKVGGGLLADVRKGSNFNFEAKRVADSVWLPATINGRGSIRILLVAGFDGQLKMIASDYRRFRTSATILSRARDDQSGTKPGTGDIPSPVSGSAEKPRQP